MAKHFDKDSNLTLLLDGKWFIRMDSNGIAFNRHQFPHLSPTDFAEEFVKILESRYAIKFIDKFAQVQQ